MRSATSPVTNPTITRQTAVATSGCFAIVNRSNGWVSKYVKVTAALTVAPTTAARDRLTPVTVVANTMANATITSLWPARKGTHRTASPRVGIPPTTKAASADHQRFPEPSSARTEPTSRQPRPFVTRRVYERRYRAAAELSPLDLRVRWMRALPSTAAGTPAARHIE